MTPNSSPHFRVRVLVALTLVVLLAHVALLLATPVMLDLNTDPVRPAPLRAFTTRTVEVVPAKPPARAPPVRPAVVVRRTRDRAPHIAPTTVPTTAPTDRLPTAPPQAADIVNPAPAQPPETAEIEQPAQAEQVASAPRLPKDTGPAPSAERVPSPGRLKYAVKANKFPYSLTSELLWQHNGDRFEAELAYRAFGQARVQTSRGELTPQGLAPIRFSDKFRTELAAHFNRQLGKVTFSANTPDAPLLAGAQDRLSILIQLATLIASAPERYPEATTLAIQTIGPRDADTWLFTVEREETLALPGGEQATLKLVRNARQAFDQKVELWLAPGLGYLPARIRITEPNGDYVDQQWLATEPQI